MAVSALMPISSFIKLHHSVQIFVGVIYKPRKYILKHMFGKKNSGLDLAIILYLSIRYVSLITPSILFRNDCSPGMEKTLQFEFC
jgi:hypothetical protein